jgi:hypothetical protein
VRGESATPLPAHGLPLGIELEIDCAETDVELRSGDLVFTYTDGLMEARREGEMYGPERLTEFVRRIGPLLTPQELVAKVHREVAGWAGGLTDDAVAPARLSQSPVPSPQSPGLFSKGISTSHPRCNFRPLGWSRARLRPTRTPTRTWSPDSG